MAITHHATLLCDYLVRADNGRFTLCGVFQNIQAEKFPAGKDPFYLYVMLSGDDGDPYEIVLILPDGEESVITSNVVRAPHEPIGNLQWSVQFTAHAAVSFGGPGVGGIAVRSNGEELHRHYFSVVGPVEVQEATEAEPEEAVPNDSHDQKNRLSGETRRRGHQAD